MELLDKINKEYKLPNKLFAGIKKSMNYSASKSFEDINNLIHSLPRKMRIEISQYIFQERYKSVKFFTETARTPQFIAWICPLLRPRFIEENTPVFEGGEVVEEIFF